MHELGIVCEVVKTVENIAREHGLSKVDTVVLQVGELTPIVPHYLEECYPAAIDKSPLKGMQLELEIIPGNGRCTNCGKVCNIMENEGRCPDCGDNEFDILSGREFMIKEILAC